MRRERSPVAGQVWTLVLAAGVLSWSCTGSPPATAPAANQAAAPVDLAATDIHSGCTSGAQQVKVLIELTSTPAGCRPVVTPASVCVAPGGKVHFKVKSECDRPARARVAEPKQKKSADGSTPGSPASIPACALEFDPLEKGQASSRHCDIDRGVPEGYYKYAVEGDGVETLDPDIEVRKSH